LKYVIIIGDGLGDYPRPELGERTPLAAARTPNLDRLAKKSLVARALTIPEGMEPGSDVANLSLLGYDPRLFHTGRAPLEAASLGLTLKDREVAFRCNLVALAEDGRGTLTMADYCSGHIPTAKAEPLVKALARELGKGPFRFHLGTQYRHLMVWDTGREDLELYPPHDLSGQVVNGHLDRMRDQCPELHELTRRSWDILSRASADLNLKVRPTSIWLWGQGRPPRLEPLSQRYGISGAMISAVDLLKGMAVYVGLKSIAIPGASGWLDTNYAGKVRAGLDALGWADFLFLHVEAPDEAGHTGSLRAKLQAIEDFDAHLVGPFLEELERLGPFRLLVACDHYTPLSVKTHTLEKVPLLLHDSRKALGSFPAFSEAVAEDSVDLSPAHQLLDILLERS
jgi:2,3-bisphosphoglycerate-independent phosphoglycerate mutase